MNQDYQTSINQQRCMLNSTQKIDIHNLTPKQGNNDLGVQEDG